MFECGFSIPLSPWNVYGSTVNNGKKISDLIVADGQVWDIVGRSLVVHSGDAPTPSSGIVAGVIARSAAVGDNDQKKICACDGTVIWVRFLGFLQRVLFA